MALLRKCYGKLRLKVNETKSAVASVKGRKFLGYSFWFAMEGRQAQGGRQADGDVQATGGATAPALVRTQHGGGHRQAQTLLVGMESLLRVGANTGNLAHAG